VTSSHRASNAVGGVATTNYQYGGLKAEAGTGRGLLGFRWIESTDTQTGTKNRNEFRQDWPYVGIPSSVRKTQSSGAVLSEMTNTPACLIPASSAACTVAPGNRYFPFLWKSVETGSDLNGAALPAVTTTRSGFDLYGNVGTITVSTGVDGHSKTTTNIYAPADTNSWILERLIRSSVQSTSP
jgi:hypothetical protein